MLPSFLHGEGPRSRCYGRTTTLRLFCNRCKKEHQWNEIDRGKPTTRRKTRPSATLSTTNPTWTDPGSNPGLRSGRPATNRLSHGTARPGLLFEARPSPIPQDHSLNNSSTASLVEVGLKWQAGKKRSTAHALPSVFIRFKTFTVIEAMYVVLVG